jgi:hypothetical protein
MTAEGLELISDTKIRARVEQAMARGMLAKLPDETVVESDLAALYLAISRSSLRRIVGNGGPRPTKNPESGSTAFNQKSLFEMGELRRWQAKNKAGGVAEQALIRGLAFQSVSDLAIEQPFWMRHQRRRDSILGHGLTLPPEIVEGLLDDPQVGVEWLPWDEALSLPWESSEQRELFEPLYFSCLRQSLDAVEAGRVATLMTVDLAESGAAKNKEGL